MSSPPHDRQEDLRAVAGGFVAGIVAEGCDAVTLLLAFESTFNGADPVAACRARIEAAAAQGYGALKERHIAGRTLAPSSRHTAAMLYGLPGWVAHIFSNPWGSAASGWSMWWGMHPTGGAWVAMHLGDHFAFSGDTRFLAEVT